MERRFPPTNPSGARRPHPARVVCTIAAVVFGVALGELGLRLVDLPPSGPFLQEFRGEGFVLMAYDSNPTGAFDLDLHDAALRARLAVRLADPAELEARWAATPWAVSIERNAQGYRERTLARRTPGTKRVAIVGDDFTLGHGLPDALAYPRLLESRLQRAYDLERVRDAAGALPTAIEVLNLGRADADLSAALRAADDALLALAPDVLVYGYAMHDPSMSRVGERERGPFRIGELARRWLDDRRVLASTIAELQRLHEPETWQPTLSRIEATSRAARARGAQFVLLLLPLPFELADSPFAEAHRGMREAAVKAGVRVVDSLPALARHPDDALRLHPRDRHPSPLYARVVAEILTPVLLEALASRPSPAADDAAPEEAPAPEPRPERERSGR